MNYSKAHLAWLVFFPVLWIMPPFFYWSGPLFLHLLVLPVAAWFLAFLFLIEKERRLSDFVTNYFNLIARSYSTYFGLVVMFLFNFMLCLLLLAVAIVFSQFFHFVFPVSGGLVVDGLILFGFFFALYLLKATRLSDPRVLFWGQWALLALFLVHFGFLLGRSLFVELPEQTMFINWLDFPQLMLWWVVFFIPAVFEYGPLQPRALDRSFHYPETKNQKNFQYSFRTKFFVIAGGALTLSTFVVLIPFGFMPLDVFFKTNFLLQIFLPHFGSFFTGLTGSMVLLVLFFVGIYLLGLLQTSIKLLLEIDREQNRDPFFVRYPAFHAVIIYGVVGFVLLGGLYAALVRTINLTVIIEHAGVSFFVFALFFALPTLSSRRVNAGSNYINWIFVGCSVIMLPVFHWYLFFPGVLLLSGVLVDTMLQLRSRENPQRHYIGRKPGFFNWILWLFARMFTKSSY